MTSSVTLAEATMLSADAAMLSAEAATPSAAVVATLASNRRYTHDAQLHGQSGKRGKFWGSTPAPI